MKKAEVIPLNKKHKRFAKLLEDYFNIAGLNAIKAIKNHVFNQKNNLDQRKKYLKDCELIFKDQRPIFKELIKEKNKGSQKDGFKNYIDFILEHDGATKNSLSLFLKDVDKVISDLNANMPLPKNLPEWYWTEYNIVNPLYHFYKKYKFKIPEEIYQMTLKIKPGFKKYFPKIDIRLNLKDDIFYPSTRYNEKSKRVTIELRHTQGDIYNTNFFIHELGHALTFLEYAEKGENYLKKTKFWNEKQALKFLFEFQEKCFPEKLKNAAKVTILNDFLIAIFENEIYTNPDQDFDKLYAQVHNRCYPKSKQIKNPTYLLEPVLIERPLASMMTSIAEFDLLSKNLV